MGFAASSNNSILTFVRSEVTADFQTVLVTTQTATAHAVVLLLSSRAAAAAAAAVAAALSHGDTAPVMCWCVTRRQFVLTGIQRKNISARIKTFNPQQALMQNLF